MYGFNLAPFKYRLIAEEGPVGTVDAYGVIPPPGSEITVGDTVYTVARQRHVLAKERNAYVLVGIDIIAAKKEASAPTTTTKE